MSWGDYMFMFITNDVIGSITNAFYEVVVKFIHFLPSSPFSFANYVSALNSILPKVNYFIPFYIFSTIFTVWIATAFSASVILLLYRWVKSNFMKG